MGFIVLILCPAAIVFAVLAVIYGNRKRDVFSILSFVCCFLPMASSLYDVIYRIHRNDIAGILDIYPTMTILYLLLFGIVTALNLYSAFQKQKEK